MNRPAKQAISYDELLGKVQNLLVGSNVCRNLHIDSLEVYLEQRDGANWDVTRHRRSGDDNDWPACWNFILKDIRLLRTTYDVRTP